MPGQPAPEAIRRAEALARRNEVLVHLLLADKDLMRDVDEGYQQCEVGESMTLEDLKREYGVSG